MTISLKCDQCGKEYRLSDDKSGKKFRCRKCNAAIQIPAVSGEYDDFGDDYSELPPTRRRKAAGNRRRGSYSNSKRGLIIGTSAATVLLVGVVAMFVMVGRQDDAAPEKSAEAEMQRQSTPDSSSTAKTTTKKATATNAPTKKAPADNGPANKVGNANTHASSSEATQESTAAKTARNSDPGTLPDAPVKPAQSTDPVASMIHNNLKCVDLSDLTGPLPLNIESSTKILERSEPWEYSTWTVIAREDDTVGYPSMVHNDRGKNPDGKYYLYYAHHDPTSGIACAIADSIEGPYHKLAKLDDSRKHSMVLVNPHSPGRVGDPSHYSSPSVVWNEDEKLWFMYFHYYNHFHRLWEEHADYPGGGNQMTALATSPDLSSHDWTIVEDEGTDKVNIPKLMPVLPTTKVSWMYGTSSYHSIQRLPTGEWLAFLRGTDKKGACSVGFARSTDGRKWSLFPENPMIRPKSGINAELGIYRPGFIGYLGKDSAGKHKYLVVWTESRKGADVPRVRYGYTTDFVKITPDTRGFAEWPGGDGLISPWRVGNKLYLFAAKYLHVMKLPVASK